MLKFFLVLLLPSTFPFITIQAQLNSNTTMTSTKNTVYLLSGLGLDPAIFKRLEINANSIHHLRWIDPQKKETLASYAQRMATSITIPKEGNLILIGHSFGGITMQEISKIIPAQQIILISSVKAKKEKSAGMNFWMRAFPVHHLAGRKLILNSFKSWGKHHGYDSPESQEIFRNAVQQHSNYYFKWATTQVCKWESEGITTPIFHIHGTKDKTFPHKKVQAPATFIENGDHIMVFNRAQEVSALINQKLSELK